MNLHELSPAAGSNPKAYRKGRGKGSGNGKTAGRGHKGQLARSGGGVRVGFEGGQMPLARRLPKRGFKNYLFKVTYSVINLARLAEAFEGKQEISLDDIYARGLAPYGSPVKVLGQGDVSAALKVEAHKFSRSAVEKLQAAGGEAKELESVAVEG